MNPKQNNQSTDEKADDIILSVRDVSVSFGRSTVLDNLDLDVYRGEILGFVGASGTGKSVLMRTILGLNQKQKGKISIFGHDIDEATDQDKLAVDMRMGVLFQHGALFSSLTVLENIQVPMREYLDIPHKLMDELARLKIELVGLKPDTADKFPSELSGGMIKRAALARALSLDPEIVFLDEPTSGLDPIGAADFDQLIADLRDTMGLTVYMVTHDLDSLFAVCDRIAVLGNKKVLIEGTIEDMLAFDDPWVKEYFRGKRARQIVSNGDNRRRSAREETAPAPNTQPQNRPAEQQGRAE
ncbi:ABC transporter ATP-binding protein [Phyllobacterium sp. SB3]|uniref:ABC transporter ATP-binding protein n=1 Tax=Phyllobacterium sp. SB3 TaxID=3156073 RepID=UPI0032AF99F0